MLSALTSASEIAFFSLTPTERGKIEAGETRKSRMIHALLTSPERLVATLSVANVCASTAFIVTGYCFLQSVVCFGSSPVISFLGNMVILTAVLLLCGVIVPKIYSAQHAPAICRMTVPGIAVLRVLFHPLSTLLMRSEAFANRLAAKESRNISVDELSQALELTDKNDIAEEQSMLKGIIRFSGETVKEVMTSRPDIVAVDIRISFPDVLRCIIQNGYSRIPVCQDSRDNIKGVLYIKDLLPYLDKGDNFRWQSLIRPPYFVPETKMIDDLLREFQQNKIHIAIVVDEFGGTSGLITMEDIIEEIVGEINDEYDKDELTYTRLDETTYLFQGKTQLSDFYKVTGADETMFEPVAEEADTLAGLLLELKGEFPQLHEKLSHGRFTFEVMEMDDRRILKIKVTLTPQKED